MTSGLAGDACASSRTRPGIARDGSGTPLTSPELFVVVDHPLKRSGSPANVPLRGVTPEAFKVHDRVKIVEGRNLEFGKNEIIAGRAASRPVRRPQRRHDAEVGREHLDAGRHLRGRRLGVGVGAVVRREGAAAGLPPRQQLPVGLREAGVAGLVPAVEGLADLEPAAAGDGDARAGLLRQPDRDAADDRPDHRRHHRRS